MSEKPYHCDVFIAGSGPIGCAFARTILTARPDAKVWMAEIGSQENPVIGAHHKNSIKYQKDIDAFVHVIQGALQPISVPPRESHMSTLGGIAWTPEFVPKGEQSPNLKKKIDQSKLTQSYHNPDQEAGNNLIGSAVTRTVGGMATHWTCACPLPHPDEREKVPYSIDKSGVEFTDEFGVKFDKAAFDAFLKRSQEMLCVNEKSFNDSMRHNIVLDTLVTAFGKDRVKSLPLAVKRRTETNKDFVTWSGSDTILGDLATGAESDEKGFKLFRETRVTRFNKNKGSPDTIDSVTVRDLTLAEPEPGKSGPKRDRDIRARYYVAACGAVSTPQLLFNSGIGSEDTLGHYLTEQSIAFCQIVLKRSIIEDVIGKHSEFEDRVKRHQRKHKQDFLPIPFNDPEPQVTIPYHKDTPWHTQIHRDAFSYGDVGPRADPRVIVDLRFFGRQEVKQENCVTFARSLGTDNEDDTVIHDLYGMPQATFHVRRSDKDNLDDHRMMLEMCKVANHLGAYLPGSYPQFMEPGLALHITGTTRLGNDPDDSVADANSRIHNYKNIWVGGNGCIPDSTACNPTLTSVAYAIKAAENIVNHLNVSKPVDQ